MPHLITFNFPNIWSHCRFIRTRSSLSNPVIRGRARDAQQVGQKATRGFPQGVEDQLPGFFDLGGVGMALITKHKIITTGTTLIALLPAYKSVLDRVRMLTIFTRN